MDRNTKQLIAAVAGALAAGFGGGVAGMGTDLDERMGILESQNRAILVLTCREHPDDTLCISVSGKLASRE